MPNLHPSVDRLINSGQYIRRPNVEIFTEHELRDKNGKVIKKVTKEDLELFAKVNNAKAEQGALTPVGPGHTYDDEYEDGKLVRKFPEEKQPKPFGYLYRYKVAKNPHSGKYSLYADEYIERVTVDADGNEKDGLQYSASFPRRSAEAYHNEHWIDWVAAIRRAPRLDLGVALYAKVDPDHALYSRDGDAAYQFERGKVRYSFDTGAGEMDHEDQDPSVPPTAEATEPEENDEGGVGETELPEEHRNAAEHYARHVFGMHHSRAKKLMQHMHSKYAAECGMDDNMNTEYAMPGPSNVPVAPAKHSEEPSRMQKDQENIEKNRYEKRLAEIEARAKELEDRAAQAEKKEFYAHMERELLGLVYEGFPINAAEEQELCVKRNYSRQQFDDRVSDIRRLLKGKTAPVGNLPPLGVTRDFIVPTKGDDGAKELEVFEQAQKYMRQTGCTWAEAKAKYSKANA